MCVSVVLCVHEDLEDTVTHWLNNLPYHHNLPWWTFPDKPLSCFHLCSTLQKLGHLLVLLSNRPMENHMRSTIKLSKPTACMQWLFQSCTEENHHKSGGKGKHSWWMWLWLETVMCVFLFGSLNKQLQQATLHLPTLELSIQNGTRR